MTPKDSTPSGLSTRSHQLLTNFSLIIKAYQEEIELLRILETIDQNLMKS